MVAKKDEKCEYCGMMFVKVKSHYPHCAVKALTDEAHDMVGKDGTIDSDEPIISPGPATEIEVAGSATEGLITDRFWAWTESFSLQMKILIDSFTGINAELNAQTKLLEDIKNNLGNSYTQRANVISSMVAIDQNIQLVATSFADAFEIIKHGKIIDEDRIEELKKEKPIRKSSPGFGTAKTQDEADLEALEEMQAQEPESIKSEGVVSGIIHWENDKTLPEHTRKLPATIEIATEKAVQLLFFNGKEAWIPRSTIKSTANYELKGDKAKQQNFVIDSWVLKKNQVIADNE